MHKPVEILGWRALRGSLPWQLPLASTGSAPHAPFSAKLRESLRMMHMPEATAMLVLLLCGDLAFVALHFIHHFTPWFDTDLLSLEQDRGYAEFYQYVKWLWIVLLLGALSRRTGLSALSAWIPLFVYFLFDDAMMLHERLGARVADHIPAGLPTFGLRTQDLGELTVSGLFFAVWSLTMLVAWRRGSLRMRQISLDLGLLVALLLFFGVVFDMLHAALGPVLRMHFAFGTVEDGGELLAVSLIVWFLFRLLIRDERRCGPDATLRGLLQALRRPSQPPAVAESDPGSP